MEKLLEEMANCGFSITIERDITAGGNTYRPKCRVSSEGGVTKIGAGDTLPLALISALSRMVSTLEGYLANIEQEREQAIHLLHRNGLVVNMLDEREIAEMRKVCPFAEKPAEKE